MDQKVTARPAVGEPRLTLADFHLLSAIEPGPEQRDLSFLPNGQVLLGSCGSDTKAWDVQSGQLLWSIPGWSNGISPDGSMLLVLKEQTVSLYSTSNGDVLATNELLDYSVHWLGMLPGGNEVLVVGEKLSSGRRINDGRFLLLSIPSLEIQQENPILLYRTHQYRFFPDGKELLTISDGQAIIWNIRSGTQARTFRQGSDDDIVITPSGEYLVACQGWTGSPDSVYIKDAKTGKLRQFLRSELIFALALSGDGGLLAGCGGNPDGIEGVIQFWDMETGTLLKTISGDEGEEGWRYQWSLALSPDASRVAMAEDDEPTIRIWGLKWTRGDD